MTKEIEDIKRRVFRIETLMWILVGVNGIEGVNKLLPLISALV